MIQVLIRRKSASFFDHYGSHFELPPLPFCTNRFRTTIAINQPVGLLVKPSFQSKRSNMQGNVSSICLFVCLQACILRGSCAASESMCAPHTVLEGGRELASSEHACTEINKRRESRSGKVTNITWFH